MTVRIVTDSTADIPQAQAQELAITIVPLTVFFGEEAYLDGV
jgi:fatty acid-binding protein DegV